MTEQEFAAAMVPLQNDPSLNRVTWLTLEPAPQIDFRQSSFNEIAAMVRCCGLSRSETRFTLESLRTRYGDNLPLQQYLDEAFQLAQQKFGRITDRDCMLTALTHIHFLFADLEKRARNHEAIEHFLEPVAGPLRWGDIWVLPGDGPHRVQHVSVNLANGLVLSKPGMGPARVEPLSSAMELYVQRYDRNELQVWRRKNGSPAELKQTFSPAPLRSWYLPLLKLVPIFR